jgi:hypothetical protein
MEYVILFLRSDLFNTYVFLIIVHKNFSSCFYVFLVIVHKNFSSYFSKFHFF